MDFPRHHPIFSRRPKTLKKTKTRPKIKNLVGKNPGNIYIINFTKFRTKRASGSCSRALAKFSAQKIRVFSWNPLKCSELQWETQHSLCKIDHPGLGNRRKLDFFRGRGSPELYDNTTGPFRIKIGEHHRMVVFLVFTERIFDFRSRFLFFLVVLTRK